MCKLGLLPGDAWAPIRPCDRLPCPRGRHALPHGRQPWSRRRCCAATLLLTWRAQNWSARHRWPCVKAPTAACRPSLSCRGVGGAGCCPAGGVCGALRHSRCTTAAPCRVPVGVITVLPGTQGACRGRRPGGKAPPAHIACPTDAPSRCAWRRPACPRTAAPAPTRCAEVCPSVPPA
jgi:hypothetical protein